MWTINGYSVKMAGESSDGTIVILAYNRGQVQPWVTARIGHVSDTSWSNGHYFHPGKMKDAVSDWNNRL